MSEVRYTGPGALSFIGAGLVLGKLFEVQPVADWSWWWVTTPFWAPLAIALPLLIIAGIIYVAVSVLTGSK